LGTGAGKERDGSLRQPPGAGGEHYSRADDGLRWFRSCAEM
jgi:hypothetical protein